jgi:hypothetical protein
MSITKTLTAAALSASLVAGGLAATTTTASAYDHRGGYGYSDRYDGPRHFKRGYGRNYGYAKPRRHRSNKGAAIALGATALIIGAIIASEHNRDRGYRRYHH